MGSKPIRVFSSGGSFNEIPYEDYANIVIDFENGKSATIEVNWITPMKVRTLSLTCEKVFAELDYMKQQYFVSSSRFQETDSKNLYPIPIEFESKQINLNNKEPLKIEITDFINSIRTRKPPLVGGMQGLLAIRIASAAIKSMKEKVVVDID